MAVYGSLTAGDSALHATSTSCRIPNAASCSRVRSNPIRTPLSKTRAKAAGSGTGSSGEARQIQASVVPATTCSPTLGRRRRQTSCRAAHGSSALGLTACTYPEHRDMTGTAQAGASGAS
jgi:hypothetical protein